MPYEVVRHPLVKSDLLNITIFIGEYAGYDLAEAKIEQIEKTLHSLTDFPHIGNRRDEIYKDLRIAISAEKAVICFTVNDETMSIFIVCISYAGADWQARVKERG
ncbi:type II toxin-antitoxin system RelE/ParE family toxin [Neorhizobium sp. P12A]|jgi:plasmid stabilization system protein ParE|uniref:type II toxin-antitoxin system RelE/ParE family toxin n=1 Tax=Neorhizobium sp. P12A TaxID=2268027 RepID=UPI0011EFC5BA|nr:type II toxin-antitoxin system RelE/ParE family toxin [Neorhizobium sp. P12A]KAA0699683.1 type II toxin-antitoxin system RelE/ParE family toxin [Neorhizobium sp. P12A]